MIGGEQGGDGEDELSEPVVVRRVNAGRKLTPGPGRVPVLVATPLLSQRGVELGRRGTQTAAGGRGRVPGADPRGVGTVEACRQVGIGWKTGYRWRANAAACRRCAWARPSAGACLSQLERQRIATLRGGGDWVSRAPQQPPRKTLGWRTPAQILATRLRSP
jgi:hypothetical protein